MAHATIWPVATVVTDLPGPPQGQWTVAALDALPDDGQRHEILNGVLYMVPPPGMAHQKANNWFQYYLTAVVQITGRGEVFGPPFEVQLAPNIAVQPDVVVVLSEHQDRITPRGVVGAPDLVIEIASPSTAIYDRNQKLRAYEAAGVPEYWIADPLGATVELLLLHGGAYQSQGVFAGAALLSARVVPGLGVEVAQFFA